MNLSFVEWLKIHCSIFLSLIQLHLKNQRGVWRNSIRPLLSVGQFRRDQEYEHTALRHQLDALCPTLYDLLKVKLDRFIGII